MMPRTARRYGNVLAELCGRSGELRRQRVEVAHAGHIPARLPRCTKLKSAARQPVVWKV
jgi:hypothetical protein